jgi:hypothetical protein
MTYPAFSSRTDDAYLYKLITPFRTPVEQVGALDNVPCSTIRISKAEHIEVC